MAGAAWGAGIQAAAQIHGQFIANRESRDQGKQARSFALHQGDIAWNRANQWYEERTKRTLQDQVTDAKAAGLHPLFALGTAGGGSSGYSPQIAQPAYTGSYAGDGIARAGGTIGKYLREIQPRKQQTEVHELQKEKMRAEITHMELLNAASRLNMLQQSTMWGDGNTGLSGNDPETRSYGYKEGPRGLPLEARPRTDSGQRSLPLRQELIADDGWRYRVLSDQAGMDELAQGDLVYQWMMRKTRQARLALPREIKIWMGRYKAKRQRRRNRTSGKTYRRKW